MSFSRLVKLIDQHGIQLLLTPEGRLRPSAEQVPPPELVDAIREHRAALVRRLERGQSADGRYSLSALQECPGICASCSRWAPSAEWGTWMGCCALPATAFEDGRPLALHAAHRCIARGGQGWKGAA